MLRRVLICLASFLRAAFLCLVAFRLLWGLCASRWFGDGRDGRFAGERRCVAGGRFARRRCVVAEQNAPYGRR